MSKHFKDKVGWSALISVSAGTSGCVHWTDGVYNLRDAVGDALRDHQNGPRQMSTDTSKHVRETGIGAETI